MNTVNAIVIRIHDELFDFLLAYREKNKDFLFLPRQNNRYDRLDQGYWFLGNENYLLINFYTGGDGFNKTGNISFGMYLKEHNNKKANTCFIHLSNTPGCPEYESKVDIITEIMRQLSGFEVDAFDPQGTPRRWNRYYSSLDYLKNIDEFLVKDKPVIDQIIKDLKNPDIGFLNSEKAKQKIADIVTRRVRRSY